MTDWAGTVGAGRKANLFFSPSWTATNIDSEGEQLATRYYGGVTATCSRDVADAMGSGLYASVWHTAMGYGPIDATEVDIGKIDRTN